MSEEEEFLRTELPLGKQGRIVIPARFRKALEVEPGDRVVLFVDESGLVISTPERLIRAMQQQFARANTGGRSLVDELIAERTEEARLEDEEEQEWLRRSTHPPSSP